MEFLLFLILQKGIIDTDLWVFCLFFSNLALILFLLHLVALLKERCLTCLILKSKLLHLSFVVLEGTKSTLKDCSLSHQRNPPWMILGLIKWYLKSAFYRGKGYTFYRGSCRGDEGTTFFGLHHRWKQSRVEFNQIRESLLCWKQ